MVITDAREVLLETALAEAKQNPLAAAFLGWLLSLDELVALMEDSATKAAAAKGGERSSRSVAVLGFACGVEKLKARFAADFATQLEWSMGRPNFATRGDLVHQLNKDSIDRRALIDDKSSHPVSICS